MSDASGYSRELEQFSTPEVAKKKRKIDYTHICIMCCYIGFLLGLAGALGYLLFYLTIPSDNDTHEILTAQSLTAERDTTPKEKVINDSMNEPLTCYNIFQSEDILKNTVDSEENLNKTTIFFIESSCKGVLDSRQACAIESAAKANPDYNVTVLFAGPMNVTFRKSLTYITLSAITNIRFSRLNFNELIKDTIFEVCSEYEWLRSQCPVVHSSEILRTLWLYKHGGIYLDLDVIVLKSFATLPKNFVIKHNDTVESSPILAMSTDGVGREFSELAVIKAHDNFDPKSFSNGRNVTMSTLNSICNTSDVVKMSNVTCNGLSFLDSDLFQPINSSAWESYYRLKNLSASFIAKDSRYYTIHLWNAYGGRTEIRQDSLYAYFAQLYCPSIYLLHDNDFGGFNGLLLL